MGSYSNPLTLTLPSPRGRGGKRSSLIDDHSFMIDDHSFREIPALLRVIREGRTSQCVRPFVLSIATRGVRLPIGSRTPERNRDVVHLV